MSTQTHIQTVGEPAVACTAWLGSSGFIFLDDDPHPWAVKEYHCGWWLHRWSDRIKEFITYRALSPAEVDAYRLRSLPPEKAALYLPNGQLTDGGPSLAPGLPKGIAGPPFGGAPGSAGRLPLSLNSHRTAAARTPVQRAMETRNAPPPGIRLVTWKLPTCIRAYG
jgi:hypothetical protein